VIRKLATIGLLFGTVILSVFCISTATAVLAAENAGDAKPAAPVLQETDWPWWRGQRRNGHAPANQTPVTTWSDAENVIWQTPVPGKGHGSPSIVGNQICLATADDEKEIQSLVCFNRKTGKQLWQTEIHKGNFIKNGNEKSSQASSSPACDGQRWFINFINNAGVYTTALDLKGKILWQTKISDYILHQGYGSSPTVYQHLVIVSSDNKAGGAVAALQRTDGKIVWTNSRPKLPNYASPIVLRVAGRDQVLITGCDLVSSFDPLTGDKLWEIPGSTTECVTSTVTDGQLMYTSGGYPRNHVAAVHADGSGKIAWENNTRVYVPSMIVRDRHLYAVTDAGVATCWVAATGQEVWKGRLGGTFSASPALVGEHVYATNEEGTSFVFKANPNAFELVAKNQLGEIQFASPIVCGNRIYMRAASRVDGKRQETLYAIGKP
jgi:outer membrane protein assembly factor BamB